MADLILAQEPRMMVYGGDLCSYGAYEYWNGEWFVPDQEALNATAPWVNATGNHEGWNDLTRAFTQSPAGDAAYFSFDYGDSHILILNTELPYGPDSPQWEFAANDLAEATAAWKVVAFHQVGLRCRRTRRKPRYGRHDRAAIRTAWRGPGPDRPQSFLSA